MVRYNDDGTQVLPGQATDREMAKRSAVYMMDPDMILVKIYGDPIETLPFRESKPRAVTEAGQYQNAAALRLGTTIRPAGKKKPAVMDSGHEAIKDNRGVGILALITELGKAGYHCVDAHFERQQKGPVNIFCFKQAEMGMPQMSPVAYAFESEYAAVNVWANINAIDPTDPSKGTKRVDTVNLRYVKGKGHLRQLRFDNGNYAIEEMAEMPKWGDD